MTKFEDTYLPDIPVIRFAFSRAVNADKVAVQDFKSRFGDKIYQKEASKIQSVFLEKYQDTAGLYALAKEIVSPEALAATMLHSSANSGEKLEEITVDPLLKNHLRKFDALLNRPSVTSFAQYALNRILRTEEEASIGLMSRLYSSAGFKTCEDHAMLKMSVIGAADTDAKSVAEIGDKNPQTCRMIFTSLAKTSMMLEAVNKTSRDTAQNCPIEGVLKSSKIRHERLTKEIVSNIVNARFG